MRLDWHNILLYETFLISIMVIHFDCKHSCLIEKNVSIVFILPRRWRDDDESLGIKTTSCCLCKKAFFLCGRLAYLEGEPVAHLILLKCSMVKTLMKLLILFEVLIVKLSL